MNSAIADPVIWVNEHNPMITPLSVTAITFSDEVRSPSRRVKKAIAFSGDDIGDGDYWGVKRKWRSPLAPTGSV